jgi:polyisoprenoid-binding protein YceI
MSVRLGFGKRVIVLMLLCACIPASSEDVYDIDPQHTFSSFEYTHWGLSRQQGRFDSTAGYIAFNSENNAVEVRIEIDATSLNTGTGEFDKTLRSADFFDVENYPKITFTSSRLQFEGERLTEVEGDLTIKGITRPIVLKIDHYHCRFMLIYGKRACGANGTAKILRSEFDMGRFTPFVSDRISLYIMVEAVRRTPPAEQ